jgi:hypothetical protein
MLAKKALYYLSHTSSPEISNFSSVTNLVDKNLSPIPPNAKNKKKKKKKKKEEKLVGMFYLFNS